MPTALALTKQNPGCELDRAGAKGFRLDYTYVLQQRIDGGKLVV
jgi:hypothetical protein